MPAIDSFGIVLGVWTVVHEEPAKASAPITTVLHNSLFSFRVVMAITASVCGAEQRKAIWIIL